MKKFTSVLSLYVDALFKKVMTGGISNSRRIAQTEEKDAWGTGL